MKRSLALITAAVTVLTLAGCRHIWEEGAASELVTVVTEFAEQTKEAVKRVTEKAVESEPTEKKADKAEITYEYVEFEEDPNLPGFSADIARFQRSIFSEKEYVQYAALSKKEKSVYEKLVSAIRSGKTSVTVSGEKISSQTAFRIYRAITTDHPEFFFLAKSFLYTASSDKVDKIILLYTDGKTGDSYNKKGRLIAFADRKKIDAQITAFSKRMSKLASRVNIAVDVLSVEKQLHDLVIDEVAYDEEAANAANDENAAETHAFDAYGAACEGKAVCEGYAKLFQYLCYRFGINCTTVSGTAQGGGHMWNAVKPGDNWTMIDVTWDDAEDAFRYYRYFNLTEIQMGKDHTVEEEELFVPSCVSFEEAFDKRFAFSVDSLSEPPENYREVLDRLMAGEDGFVCVTMSGTEKQMSRYIRRYLLGFGSAVQAYIYEAGLGISFSGESYLAGEYLYLSVNRD